MPLRHECKEVLGLLYYLMSLVESPTSTAWLSVRRPPLPFLRPTLEPSTPVKRSYQTISARRRRTTTSLPIFSSAPPSSYKTKGLVDLLEPQPAWSSPSPKRRRLRASSTDDGGAASLSLPEASSRIVTPRQAQEILEATTYQFVQAIGSSPQRTDHMNALRRGPAPASPSHLDALV